jgi:ribosomal protein S18 acetylase RimI-like enzyme
MNRIAIRTANLEDVPTLLLFEQGVLEAERPLDPFLGDGELTYYDIPALITSKDTQYILAISKQEIVGCGYLKIENSQQYHKNPQHGYIGFMYVKPAFRGQKISALILDSLKNWGKEKGLKELRLDVYHTNTSALKSYEGFGFAKSLVNMRINI